MGCQEVDCVPDNENPVASAATTIITDAPANMSREELYSMVAQQNIQRRAETSIEDPSRDDLQTPSPPPNPRIINVSQNSSSCSGLLLRYQ